MTMILALSFERASAFALGLRKRPAGWLVYSTFFLFLRGNAETDADDVWSAIYLGLPHFPSDIGGCLETYYLCFSLLVS